MSSTRSWRFPTTTSRLPSDWSSSDADGDGKHSIDQTKTAEVCEGEPSPTPTEPSPSEPAPSELRPSQTPSTGTPEPSATPSDEPSESAPARCPPRAPSSPDLADDRLRRRRRRSSVAPLSRCCWPVAASCGPSASGVPPRADVPCEPRSRPYAVVRGVSHHRGDARHPSRISLSPQAGSPRPSLRHEGGWRSGGRRGAGPISHQTALPSPRARSPPRGDRVEQEQSPAGGGRLARVRRRGQALDRSWTDSRIRRTGSGSTSRVRTAPPSVWSSTFTSNSPVMSSASSANSAMSQSARAWRTIARASESPSGSAWWMYWWSRGACDEPTSAAAQHEKRHIVPRPPPLPQPFRQVVGQRLGPCGPGTHLVAQRVDPGVEVGAGLLHKTVRVQHERLTGHQIEPGLRILLVQEVRGGAQRQPAAYLRTADPPVDVADQRAEMPGPHDLHRPGRQVDLGVRTGGEALGVQFGEEREARASTVAGGCPSEA